MSLPPDTSLVRLDDKWRVVIPKAVRKAAGLTAGGRLVVFSTGDGVVLKKAEIVLEGVRP